MARGLEYLHTSKPSIIHGDLKGVNILVKPSGRACLADFGLASAEDSQAVVASSSSNHRITGTSRWQAPELLDTEMDGSGRNSLASDIYSFACVCYEVRLGKVSANTYVLIFLPTGLHGEYSISRAPERLSRYHRCDEKTKATPSTLPAM